MDRPVVPRASPGVGRRAAGRPRARGDRRGRAAARHEVVHGPAGPDRHRPGVVQGQRRVAAPRGRGDGAGRRPAARRRAAAARGRPRPRLDADGRRRPPAPRGAARGRVGRPLAARASQGRRDPACLRGRGRRAAVDRGPGPAAGHAPGSLRPAGDRARPRAAVPRGDVVRRGAVRAARRPRHPRDAAARRPPRRPGLRARRHGAGHGLGGLLHLPPVLHAVGHPRGRDRLGPRRRGETASTPSRSATPTSSRTPRRTPTSPVPTCTTRSRPRSGWAGPPASSTATSPARTTARGCGCSWTGPRSRSLSRRAGPSRRTPGGRSPGPPAPCVRCSPSRSRPLRWPPRRPPASRPRRAHAPPGCPAASRGTVGA